MGPRDRDDRDPFDDIFRELSRMMNDMMGDDVGVHVQGNDAGFGDDVHITTQQDDERVYVVADLPGVQKDAIDIKCDGRTLTVAAATDHREYEERLRLPVRVDEHSATATFKNGILEVIFERADSSANIDLD
ncbi:Hsp20/alpha crystallin family protein [Halomarina halobia]|uniref:Hsp20/alpha crystallin family protein n=1 Tax=Halomarina halobia TaxID=3033386 RepID=A0ABD6ABR5_9EURY|nr:Hsp20/alpha crystallin family protein [Halomarina sp. PSR21]